jgi:hypothetical protein
MSTMLLFVQSTFARFNKENCAAAAAADEKSTFERLMAGYSVNKQPLLQPRRLTTLTPMDQQVRMLCMYIQVYAKS